jgi:hypothetical protein
LKSDVLSGSGSTVERKSHASKILRWVSCSTLLSRVRHGLNRASVLRWPRGAVLGAVTARSVRRPIPDSMGCVGDWAVEEERPGIPNRMNAVSMRIADLRQIILVPLINKRDGSASHRRSHAYRKNTTSRKGGQEISVNATRTMNSVEWPSWSKSHSQRSGASADRPGCDGSTWALG